MLNALLYTHVHVLDWGVKPLHRQNKQKHSNTSIYTFPREARWPSGRASDSEARGRGSILTQVAELYP